MQGRTPPILTVLDVLHCRWYTGHVTAGGSICIAALTLSGNVNSWTPDYSVESILNVVLANMCVMCTYNFGFPSSAVYPNPDAALTGLHIPLQNECTLLFDESPWLNICTAQQQIIGLLAPWAVLL